MAEYIEREALMEEVRFKHDIANRTGMNILRDAYAVTLMQLRDAPAADVVEVMRCKDCKNNPQFETKKKGMAWCRRFRSYVKLTGFCDSGERRGE